MLWQCAGFLAFFIPLRRYAGGYHAKTRRRCYVASICLLAVELQFMEWLVCFPEASLVLGIIFGVAIWSLVPMADRNKPLNELEYRVFKRRTRMVLAAEAGALLLLLAASLHSAASCIVGAWTASGCLLHLKKAVNIYGDEAGTA